MNYWILIIDVLCAVNIIITLNLVQKYNKMWIVYAIGNFLYCTLMWYKGLPALAIMGVVLFFTGINNYRKGRKKK